MTYTQIALIAVFIAAFIDLEVLRTKLLKRKVFWTSYAIIVPFQLLTNWWLTSKEIVMYTWVARRIKTNERQSPLHMLCQPLAFGDR